MSTFSGLNTAASGLAAARRAMDVVGQNIANQTTEGYTRQRVTTESVAAVAQSGRFSLGAVPGQGVAVTGIARLSDALVDARLRDAVASSGYWSTRAVAVTAAETSLAEPTSDGLAARMSAFWAGWQDLANSPDSPAAASVVLDSAAELTGRIASGYRAVATQWSDARATVDRTVVQINAAADRIAELNESIRNALAGGQNANELIDQRDLLAQNVARMTGGSATLETDGTLTVRISGNALVSGSDARHLVASGATSIEDGERVTLTWEDSSYPIAVTDGELGGTLAVLAPADDGGPLAQLAAGYNKVATALAQQVNAQHSAGVTAGGDPGGDFFALAGTGPAALGLSVVPTSGAQLALGNPGGGALDSGNADAISQVGAAAGSPDSIWAEQVLRFGVSTAGDVQRARLADTAAATATNAQRSIAAVDGDEETINLVTYQAAYQASARVISAIDEALDVLINKTGIVGR